MKNLAHTRVGYARETGERRVEAGSAFPSARWLAIGRKAYVTSSSGRSRVRLVSRNQELRGEARLETAAEPSQVRGTFRSPRQCSHPEGIRLLLHDRHGRDPLDGRKAVKRPKLRKKRGAQRWIDVGEWAGVAMPAKPPDWGGTKNRVTQLRKERQPEG